MQPEEPKPDDISSTWKIHVWGMLNDFDFRKIYLFRIFILNYNNLKIIMAIY